MRFGQAIIVMMMGWTLFVACASTSEKWTGSVDAVFRYRPEQSSTVVFNVRPDSFSLEAGLQPGDVLLAVDGTDITNASFTTVRTALRGPVGTKAVLTIKRGDTIMEFDVERRPIASSKSDKDQPANRKAS